MNEQKIFDTLEHAIVYIIEQLDTDEKDLIKNGDPMGLHMALDRWIKNDYVFSRSTNINELIYGNFRNEDPYYRDNPDKELNIHPDNLSGDHH